MTPIAFLETILVPGLVWLESVVGPVPPASKEARLLLLGFAGIESHWANVAQAGGGPGRGGWQDEPETCSELLHNPVSQEMMLKICAATGVPHAADAIWCRLLGNTNLQVAVSRLDLWCDPRPLAGYGDVQAGWDAYDRIWRPGKPRPAVWDGIYADAVAADQAWLAANPSKV